MFTLTVNGDGSSAYWIRCLPHDFPQLTPTHYAAATPGWRRTHFRSRSIGPARRAEMAKRLPGSSWTFSNPLRFQTTTMLASVGSRMTLSGNPNGHLCSVKLRQAFVPSGLRVASK